MKTNSRKKIIYILGILIFLLIDTRSSYSKNISITDDSSDGSIAGLFHKSQCMENEFNEGLFAADTTVDISKIYRQCKDSTVVDKASHKIYLYGNASMKYMSNIITGDKIIIDETLNKVYAFGSSNKNNQISKFANLKNSTTSISSKEIIFDLKTQKYISK